MAEILFCACSAAASSESSTLLAVSAGSETAELLDRCWPVVATTMTGDDVTGDPAVPALEDGVSALLDVCELSGAQTGG